jgi:hypothetical protein
VAKVAVVAENNRLVFDADWAKKEQARLFDSLVGFAYLVKNYKK